jgi:Flp pilus assembly protein TadD
MTHSEPADDLEAFRLMRAGDFGAALPFAQRAVAGARSCRPAHGLLASILLQLGSPVEAERVVTEAEALSTGIADA